MKLLLATTLGIILGHFILGFSPHSTLNNYRRVQNQHLNPPSVTSLTSAVNDIETIPAEWNQLDGFEFTMKQENILRSNYNQWCNKYNKSPSDVRYRVFKENYLSQLRWNQENGQAFGLNEYGDCTKEEYENIKARAIEAVEADAMPVFTQNIDADLVEIPNSSVSVDDADKQLALMYESIEAPEARAFEIMKDLGLVAPPPQHFSFSYIDYIPEWSQAYSTSILEGNGGGMTSYLDTLRLNYEAGENAIFPEGKLKTTRSYLDDICDVIEPFLDCEKARTISQPKSPEEEQQLQAKYAAIKNLGDRCYQILVDLCMVNKCEMK